MGYLLHILLALGGQALVENGLALPGVRPWLLLPCALVPHALGLLVRRASVRGSFRFADLAHHALVWSPPVLHIAVLVTVGWLEGIEDLTGMSPHLMSWPHPVQLLSFVPFLVFALLSIDARARLGGARPEAVAHLRRFQTRMLASALVPVALYVLVSYALGLVPGLRVNVEEVAVWSAAFTVGVLTCFLLVLPWVLCNTWETVPLGPGVQRSLLEAVAERARFRCRDLLVWRTGNLLANAAIVGMFPRGRYVLFSDSLLAQLPLRELAAVYAHEIGHARRHHVIVFAAWSASFFLAGDLLTMAFFPDSEWAMGAIFVMTIASWYALVGFLSRRFELEADLESLRLTGDADALIAALEQIGGVHTRRDSSWRHFSTGDRVAFLRSIEKDPAVGVHFGRALRRWSRAGLALAGILVLLEAASLVRSWPEDRVMVDLRVGDYQAALARIEAHPVPEELALLVRRGVELRPGGTTKPLELERAARAALRRGRAEEAAAYLDLAVIRGDAELVGVREALGLSLDGSIQEARSLLERQTPSWRADFEAFLARSP